MFILSCNFWKLYYRRTCFDFLLVRHDHSSKALMQTTSALQFSQPDIMTPSYFTVCKIIPSGVNFVHEVETTHMKCHEAEDTVRIPP